MSTVTKLVLGAMGRLRPRPAQAEGQPTLALPAPNRQGGMPLLEALAARRSIREFAPDALPLPVLSQLLWCAFGRNRDDGGRTAPSAINAQEIDVYVVDHSRMKLIPVASRESYASAAAGAIAQNVYLYAASAGLVTVIRAWIDRSAIADALGLSHDQHVLLSQTVGYPKG